MLVLVFKLLESLWIANLTRLIKSRQLRGSCDIAVCGASNQEVKHADFSRVTLGVTGTHGTFSQFSTAQHRSVE